MDGESAYTRDVSDTASMRSYYNPNNLRNLNKNTAADVIDENFADKEDDGYSSRDSNISQNQAFEEIDKSINSHNSDEIYEQY